MCRSIHTLHNFEPPTTPDEVRAASLQYVRKVSGMTKPARVNQEAFDRAVEAIEASTRALLDSLVATAAPHDRETEYQRARARWEERQGRTATSA
jgi:hypothetical protein